MVEYLGSSQQIRSSKQRFPENFLKNVEYLVSFVASDMLLTRLRHDGGVSKVMLFIIYFFLNTSISSITYF